MGKIVRLTESELVNLVKKIVNESTESIQAATEINQIFSEEGVEEVTPDELDKIKEGDQSTQQQLESRYGLQSEMGDVKVEENEVISFKEQIRSAVCKIKNDRKSVKSVLKEAFQLRRKVRKMKREKMNEQDGSGTVRTLASTGLFVGGAITLTSLALSGSIGIWIAALGMLIVLCLAILIGAGVIFSGRRRYSCGGSVLGKGYQFGY